MMQLLGGKSVVASELGALLTQYSVQQVLFAGGLLAARILGMIFLAPFLGGRLVPAQVKIGVALALGVAVFPYVVNLQLLNALFAPNASEFPLVMRMVGYIIKEVFVGVILGFIILTIWHGAEMIGRFVDTARGSAMGTALVPEMGTSASTLGSLYYQLMLVIFLFADGHLIFLDYFCKSFVYIPISSVPHFGTPMWPFYDILMRITADLFLASIVLSAPIMISIFIADICMGLFNKVAPQINIMFLMMPFKAVLGIYFSMLALVLYIQKSEEMMSDVLTQVWLAIKYMAPFK